MILGIDEVGRGPWAGPLVVGAVVLGDEIEGLADSKKLGDKRRRELAKEIKQKAKAVGLGWVHANEIDELGLSEALKLACKRAVERIKVPYHEIIIDGTVNFLAGTTRGDYVTTLKKADQLISSVSAASIVAKVARDDWMIKQDAKYPGYGFASHVGYGTAKHQKALQELGPTPIHRISFRPIGELIDGTHETQQSKFRRTLSRLSSLSSAETRRQGHLKQSSTSRGDNLNKVGQLASADYSRVSSTTKQVGDLAEGVAAEHLESLGHEILDRNWKTKFCEIDIVSKKDSRVYFVEVKYRRKAKWGDGLDAITKKKLKQMKFASEIYDLYKDLDKFDRQLVVISLSGEPPRVERCLEIE